MALRSGATDRSWARQTGLPVTLRTILAFQLRRSMRGAFIWGIVAGILVASMVSLYESAYPDPAGRAILAAGLGTNKSITAILGTPYGIDAVAGFVVWRIGAPLAVILAVWGLLAGTRLLRGDEEIGRWQVLIAQPITQAGATGASLVAFSLASCIVFAMLLTTSTVSFPASQYTLADATAHAAAYSLFAVLFAGIGAVASQFATTRRMANLAAGGVLIVMTLLRVLSDGVESLGWMTWLTPAGWVAQVRPFAGVRMLPLILLGGATFFTCALATLLASRRDTGGGLLADRSTGRTEGWLLGTPVADAFRFSRAGLGGWIVGIGTAALVFGAMGPGAVRALLESEFIERLGTAFPAEIATVSGYLSFVLALVIGVMISLVAAWQVSVIRDEEASGRVERILAAPVSRRIWLWSRIGVCIASTTVLAGVAGFAAWAGQALLDGGLLPGPLVRAGLGLVPLACLFAGIGIFLFGFAPRISGPAVWGLVAGTSLVELIGPIVNAPKWILVLSPFHHVALAPLYPVDIASSGIMVALGALLAFAGVEAFARRDVVSL